MSTKQQLEQWLITVGEQRDRAAFREMMLVVLPKITAYVRRSGHTSEQVDELLQNWMLRVWRNAHQFDSRRGSAWAWFYGISRNLIRDGYRKRQRVGVDYDDPLLQVSVDTPLELTSSRHRAARIQAAVKELPAPQREVVEVVFFKAHTFSEAATILQIPVGTAKSRFRLASKKLREHLSDLEVNDG